MTSASVVTVYNTLIDLVNKDQRGMVTPSIFNSFAQLAQVKIFNEMFKSLVQAKNIRIRGIDPADNKSLVKQVKEDLSNFLKTKNISKAASSPTDEFKKPDDISRLVSISSEASDSSSNVNIDNSSEVTIDIVYDKDHLRRILRSPVVAPKASHPVAFFGEEIIVYPSSVTDIKLTYYKIPQGRTSSDARTTSVPAISFISNTGVADASNSVNFELPEHYTDELVFEIGSMIGLNLRDADVVNYSQLKEKE